MANYGERKSRQPSKTNLDTGKGNLDSPFWNKEKERALLEKGQSCSVLLARITQRAMGIRQSREPQQPESENLVEDQEEPVALVPRPVPRPWVFITDTWAPNWLLLVCHYFDQLRWPADNCPNPGKVSLIELRLDLFISFQTTGPLNVRTLGGKFLQDVPQHDQKSKLAYYFLPSPSQSKQLPNPLLVRCSSSAGAITVPRANAYCLGKCGATIMWYPH